MALVTQAPRFSTGTPVVLNAENGLSVVVSIGNIGDGLASNVWVTGITLGSASRLSPEGLPLFIGTMAPVNTSTVTARFATAGLVVGNKYLATVRGTYESGEAKYAFIVNRHIVIPAFAPNPVPLLEADVEVDAQAGVWTCTVFNDEPPASRQYVATFALEIALPRKQPPKTGLVI